MIGENVEAVEIVIVVSMSGPSGHAKAEIGKNGDNLRRYLRKPDGCCLYRAGPKQAHIHAFCRQPRIEMGGFKRRFTFGEGGGHAVAQTIDQRPVVLRSSGFIVPKDFKKFANHALLAQGFDAHFVKRALIARGFSAGEKGGFDRLQVLHQHPLLAASASGRTGGKARPREG